MQRVLENKDAMLAVAACLTRGQAVQGWAGLRACGGCTPTQGVSISSGMSTFTALRADALS